MIVQRFEENARVKSFHDGQTKYAQVGDPTSTFVQLWNLDGSPLIDNLSGRRLRVTIELVDEAGALEGSRTDDYSDDNA